MRTYKEIVKNYILIYIKFMLFELKRFEICYTIICKLFLR